MNLKNFMILCGVFILWIAIAAGTRFMDRNDREPPAPSELAPPIFGLPGLGLPHMVEPSPHVISCANGVFIFADAKLIKMDKTSLKHVGEIKLPQGYIPIGEVKSYKVAKNANGVERILVFKLSKMLVIDTASCKVLRTIALPVVPSPAMGAPQGGNIAVGPSPYSFVDEPVVKNSDVVYLVCGPSIAAVNFESGKMTVTRNALIPGRP